MHPVTAANAAAERTQYLVYFFSHLFGEFVPLSVHGTLADAESRARTLNNNGIRCWAISQKVSEVRETAKGLHAEIEKFIA